jgi:hypothetical protein
LESKKNQPRRHKVTNYHEEDLKISIRFLL